MDTSALYFALSVSGLTAKAISLRRPPAFEAVGEDGLTAGDYSDASLDYCKLLFNSDFRSHCTPN